MACPVLSVAAIAVDDCIAGVEGCILAADARCESWFALTDRVDLAWDEEVVCFLTLPGDEALEDPFLRCIWGDIIQWCGEGYA